MTEGTSPAQHAEKIAAARDRLLAFAAACSDEAWHSRPLTGRGDGRAVGVIVDHVADAYEYMSDWMRQILAGEDPEVDVALVDRLNAGHAIQAGGLTQAQVAEHLGSSGDAMISLVSGLADSDLESGGGRIRRFAEIAARHPDTHRSDIEDALRTEQHSAGHALG